MGCNYYVWNLRRVHLLSVLLIFTICDSSNAVQPHQDICGNYNGRRLYLEMGDRGILSAQNITMAINSSHGQCSLELITCPSCMISLTFLHLDLPHRCGGANIVMDGNCPCEYVWVSEPPNGDSSIGMFCGVQNTPSLTAPQLYRSQTRTVSIVLLFSENHLHAFTLEYSAQRNFHRLQGLQNSGLISGSSSNASNGGVLFSPFFPVSYAQDLNVEYEVICTTEANVNCRIRLIFLDFQLATVSVMEFYDSNGTKMEVSSGAKFRPPIILTTGPKLSVRFKANGRTGLGYRAIYSFVWNNLKDEIMKPITDCGGYVENLGGAITMMNMIQTGVQAYDCIWLIRPHKNYLNTHLYLKVVAFLDMGGRTELQVREGLTSLNPVVETIRHPMIQGQSSRNMEHLIAADLGFYVSLRGAFSPPSRLEIVYSSFSYKDCVTDFQCNNHRCIPMQLNCDGFDHCGDNSDEPPSCWLDSEIERQFKSRFAHKPNYYFPKMDRYPDLKTATMVFVASSLGMILLISALVVLLYHMGSRARQQRELHSQLQSISELLDGTHTSTTSQLDDPPTYEAPPTYDEIIKVRPEPAVSSRPKRKRRQRVTSNRSVPRAVIKINNALEHLADSPSTSVTVSSSSQTTPLPDSPPPPYMPSMDSTYQPSGSMTPPARLSHRGSRARQSWLLFKDDTSSEEHHLRASQQCEDISANEVPTPSYDSHCQIPCASNTDQNLQLSDSANVLQESNGDPLVNNLLVSFVSSVDNENASDEELDVTHLIHTVKEDELHRISYLFNSSELQDGIEDFDKKNGHNSLEEFCDCQGACGCANGLVKKQSNAICSLQVTDEAISYSDQNFLPVDALFFQYDRSLSDNL